MRRLAALAWSLALPGFAAVAAEEPVAARLLGRRPTEWTVSHWSNGAPLTLEGVRGRVVLVRWWTAPYCSFCRASAPALNEFHDRYREGGLVVLGFYHHKNAGPLDAAAVGRWADDLGFQFPVAIDDDWVTLRRWWLDEAPASWTSVSFLLDRGGAVRHVHPGGEYVKGDADYAALEARIEELLAERTAVFE